jgi:hypothetical protein
MSRVARREIEDAFLLLVIVPEDVQRDRVHAHRLRHADPLPPVLDRNARRVHLTRDDLEGFSVENEIVLAQGKGVALTPGSLSRRARSGGRRCECQGGDEGGGETLHLANITECRCRTRAAPR